MEGVRVGGGLEEQQGLFKYVCTTCEHTPHTDIRTYVRTYVHMHTHISDRLFFPTQISSGKSVIWL